MAGRFTGYPTSQAAIVLPSGHSIAPANVRRHNRVVESLVHMRKGFVMRILAGTMGVILLSIPVHAQTVKTPVACEALSSLKLANTTIALATSVPAGTLRLSAGGPVAADLVLNDLPAFCRVSATLKPSPEFRHKH